MENTSTILEFPYGEEYFSIIGNNIVDMGNDSLTREKYFAAIFEWQDILKNLIGENVLELEDNQMYFSFLQSLREKEQYEDFLRITLENDQRNNIKAILLFFVAQEDFVVLGCEENFVLSILDGEDVDLQECAIDCLLTWDIANDIERLERVYIKNTYLQRDLDEFIKDKKAGSQ